MSLNLFSRIKHRSNHEDLFGANLPSSDDNVVISQQNTPVIVNRSNPFTVFQPLPPFSTVLGICDDGLPLLLDLNDPNPGAILISGQQHSGITRLLRSIILSACTLNTPDQLYFHMITPNPGLNHDMGNFDHCYGVYSSYDKAACELVVDLAALVEQRKSGRHLGVKCILAIDNLYEMIKHQDFEVINHLRWLYRFGANNGIWVISTLESERSNMIEDGLLDEQKTQIVAGSEAYLLPDSSHQNQRSQDIQSYRTRIGREWVDFWLPSIS